MLKITGMVCLASLFIVVILTNVCLADTSNLIAYWSFDEGKGMTVKDLSGNNNNGTIKGGVTWVNGKYGSALNFDGTTGYVNVPDADILKITGTKLTIAAWVSPLPPAGGGTELFFVSKYKYADGQGYSLGIYTGKAYAKIGTGKIQNVLSTTEVPSGEWIHIAVVYDGSKLNAYLDGKLDNAGDATGDILGWVGDLNIGGAADAPGNSNFLFHGIMDELKIWKNALTPKEIEQSMSSGTTAVSPQTKIAIAWGSIKNGR